MPIILSPHRTDERIAGHPCLLRDYGRALRIRPPEGGDRGPIACATATAVLFGAYEQQSPVNFLFTAPEIVWEVSLGIWLVTKGFRPCPLITGTAPQTTQVPETP
ncbi:hypothetical protein BKA00_003824 [Actinomadura coerulea]|uniref:Uncharacterized protein n=1 Tax=Actinomadura coerulea TaxID=46159 RepID=A0A7X0G1E5_9ACTN|nr:hypothetical protein [Actinomadura coerulea]GGP95274.1 hypothetical protein GCM10010187_08520 [Actinomadura coerulea]